MHIEPIGTALGARVTGLDLRDPRHQPSLLEALSQYAVLAFPDQNLNPPEQLALGRRFGTINSNRYFSRHPQYPEMALVVKEVDHQTAVGEGWHTDHSYDRAPAMCSLLQAMVTPSQGGDTQFASTSAAYAALDGTTQAELKGLWAWHSSSTFAELRGDPRYRNLEEAPRTHRHPLVIRHPLSGQPSLYVNPGFTLCVDGWSQSQSDALLQRLYAHISQPRFCCQVSWQVGTLTLWDNHSSWHKASNDYPGQRRVMHRVTVDGAELKPA